MKVDELYGIIIVVYKHPFDKRVEQRLSINTISFIFVQAAVISLIGRNPIKYFSSAKIHK